MSIPMACLACHTRISDEGTGEPEPEVGSLPLFAIGLCRDPDILQSTRIFWLSPET